MSEIGVHPPARPGPSLPARVLPALALVVALAAGVWLIGAFAPGITVSVVLTGLWFLAVGAAAEILTRRRPSLGVALRAAFVVALAASSFGFYWTSVRDDVVNETVVSGVAASSLPAADAAPARPAEPTPTPAPAPEPPAVNVTETTGAFESLAHASEGTASVVRLPSGERVLTLTGFRTDNGPDLRVQLVAGAVNGNGDGDGSIDLGALKGNLGDQQYAIPADADLDRYATVVIWCRAFTVGFAKAGLRAA